MKLEVDQTKCTTSGICVRELPEVFHFKEGSKKASVRNEDIQLCMYEKCLEVAAHCPNKAIVIINE